MRVEAERAMWQRKRDKLERERRKWSYSAYNSLDRVFAAKQVEKLTEAINKIDSYLKRI